jgi:hypothetical protein
MSGVFQNIDPPPPGECVPIAPPPPPPPLVRGEDTLAGWIGGGGSVFWKTLDTALYSTYVKYTLCAGSTILTRMTSWMVWRSSRLSIT